MTDQSSTEIDVAKQFNALTDAIFSADPDTQPKTTEGDLLGSRKWLNSSKRMYRLMMGKPFTGTDEEAGRFGINLIADFNYKTVGLVDGDIPIGPTSYQRSNAPKPGETVYLRSGPVKISDKAQEPLGKIELRPGMLDQFAALVKRGSTDDFVTFNDMLNVYEKLPNWTAAGSYRMARGLMQDIATYGAAFVLPARVAAGALGREALAAELAKLMTQRQIAMGAGSGAIQAGGETVVRQQIAEEAGADLPPGTDPRKPAQDVAKNAGLGGIISGALGGLGKLFGRL